MDCCPTASPELSPFAQLLSIGLLWTTVHCAGMCGPILVGLTASRRIEGGTAAGRAARAVGGVLAYQGGRGLMYALLGAGAGLAGAALEAQVQGLARAAGLVLAALLVGAGLWSVPGAPWSAARARVDGRAGQASGRFLAAVLRRIGPWLPRSGAARMAVTGFALGLLPCMLMFWALGLAAATADPLRGALLMLGLVALTTPVLALAGCSAVLADRFRPRAGAAFVPAALLLSGAWLGLIAAAANGWIAHLHIPFHVFGRDLTIMLW